MRHNRLNAVALATSALLTLPATAETVYYDPVSAIAAASYTSGCSFVTVDNALDWFGKAPGAESMIAAAEAGSANAGAALSLPNVAVAVAQAKGGAGCVGAEATGILTGSATVYDPQGRASNSRLRGRQPHQTPIASRRRAGRCGLQRDSTSRHS